MPPIKNWTKIIDKSSRQKWKIKDSSKSSYHTSEATVLLQKKRNPVDGIEWMVEVKDPYGRIGHKNKRFDKKEKAKDYALEYMKNH